MQKSRLWRKNLERRNVLGVRENGLQAVATSRRGLAGPQWIEEFYGDEPVEGL
jgi:hypothetical protein